MADRIIITKENLKNGQSFLLCARYDAKRMVEVQLQQEGCESLLGNIYVGRISNIVENIQAAFVEIEKGRSCFFPLQELKHPVFVKKQGKKPLCIGDELLVEVVKENLKTKPPMVSSNLNFTGKYLVLTTGNRVFGVSKKLNAVEKARFKELLEPLMEPEYGIIVRTGAKEAADTEILEEFEQLREEASRIIEEGRHRTVYSAVRKAEPFYMTFLKGISLEKTGQITTDIPQIYESMLEYAKSLPKEAAEKFCFYEDSMVSLAAVYSLKHELSRALEPKVWLQGGGYLVIEPTEALTVIDVNSGKNLKRKTKEELIFGTNKEAAQEIARQLILRNISGICVIDFIDMKEKKNQEELMQILRAELKKDKVPTSLVDITGLGLVELTRKKVKKSLKEQLQGEEPHEK